MHFSTLLMAAAAAFTQGSLAVNVLVYSGYDCTGTVTNVAVDGGAACKGTVPRFMSYKENGWGPSNGQRIAFYQGGTCATNSFLYDTYSNNGDYFQSKKCYNINGHSPSQYASSMNLY